LSINVGCSHTPHFTFHPFHTALGMTDTFRLQSTLFGLQGTLFGL